MGFRGDNWDGNEGGYFGWGLGVTTGMGFRGDN